MQDSVCLWTVVGNLYPNGYGTGQLTNWVLTKYKYMAEEPDKIAKMCKVYAS